MIREAKWIWPVKEFSKGQRAIFRFTAKVEADCAEAELLIGCETKYWLFVNGIAAVFDGGLFRESLPGCGYFDRVDISPYLKIGTNEIILHVWYFGNGGRNNVFCEKPGLILACPALDIISDESTLCEIDQGYVAPDGVEPTFLYGGGHTAYDGRIRPFSLCPTLLNGQRAQVLGKYGDKPWGELLERPVPRLFFTERIPCPHQDGNYLISLPHAMHFSPYFKVRASRGTRITVLSDRYKVNGGPGDFNHYFGHRAEYICREGEQEFELLDWLFGEKIIFKIPEGVEVLELGYRESGYDSRVTTELITDDPEVNLLFEKCVRTLRVCMRENYMDCPDRERGQWIGDVSVQAPQVVYLLDGAGMLLLKKAIRDFINLRKGDVLVGNVPGDNWCELPSQSLNAISEVGMVATYYAATKDKEILSPVLEPAVRYLMLWQTDSEGLPLPRAGNWEWYDHLYNCDGEVLNLCWYYSALRFAQTMAEELDDHRFDAFIRERASAIEGSFDRRYWREKGNEGYYSSGGTVDDRANAMAVLSGLCTKERYPKIRYVLTSVFNSTTYMENYVLIALCQMGYKADAFKRMMCRYQPLIKNENTTLWEDFFHLGTKNHAWSGGPATLLLRYFAGIAPDLSVTETDIAPIGRLRCRFIGADGKAVTIERRSK